MKKILSISFAIMTSMGIVESQGAEFEKSQIIGSEFEKSQVNRDYKNWAFNIRGTIPEFSFEYQVRKFPAGFDKVLWSGELNPTCSILMSNGAQIDYVPGKVAVWILRDEGNGDLARLSHVITGTFNKNDMYKLDGKQFAEKIMCMKTIFLAQSVHITYSDKGIFPIEHPQDIYERVIKKWFEDK